MKKLTIAGMGLMGGSIGLAARKRRIADVVCGFARRAESRTKAIELGAADETASDLEAAVEGADMVVFCVPVLAIPELASRCAGVLGEGCVVTDVGSTKKELQAEMENALAGSRAVFVGSHPIAGSEMTGLSAARADLYEGATVVVTESGAPCADERVVDMWRKIGACVRRMSADRHDRIVARTSHLPHVAAAALVQQVLASEGDFMAEFCGGGFRDTTRIAAGSEEVWHDIVKTNRDPVVNELEGLCTELEKLTEMIRAGDFDSLRGYLSRSAELRRSFNRK